MADSENAGGGLRDSNDSDIGVTVAFNAKPGGTLAEDSKTRHAVSLNAKGTSTDPAHARIGIAYADKSEVDVGRGRDATRLESAAGIALHDRVRRTKASGND